MIIESNIERGRLNEHQKTVREHVSQCQRKMEDELKLFRIKNKTYTGGGGYKTNHFSE